MDQLSITHNLMCLIQNFSITDFHFSFQHQMSLRRNATEFAERVRAAPISGNIDNPEGGLDALMQVK